MALHVSFWGFGKRENSTIIPDTPALRTYNDLQLKGNCSIVNPSLKINEPVTENVHVWNYCYIAEFRRYYYVTDWVWDSGIWIAALQVDVLASFKLEIGFQSFYILRSYQDSSGNYLYNGDIIDTTYPCTAGAPTYLHTTDNNPFSGFYQLRAGVYIVGLINQSAAGVSYYCFDNTSYLEFCSKLFNYSTGWVNIDPTEISEDLQKALINPFQYVVSSLYLPMPYSWFADYGAGTLTNTVKFGWWSLTLSGYNARVLPKGVLYQIDKTLTIPKHPEAASRGNYLNLNPYSIYTLRYYPFGVFDLDSEAISNYSTLNLHVDVDVCTGKAILTVSVGNVNTPIRVIEGNISVPIPTVSVNVDYMNLGSRSTLVAAGATALSQMGTGESGSWFQNVRNNARELLHNISQGNWSEIKNDAVEVFSNIASAAIAAKATAEITGQQGTYTLADTQKLTISGRFLPLAPDDFSHRGRPLCQTRMINTLQGFIQCADADVYIACTEREKAAIKAYLESGFFYFE